jgi:ABC-type nitrate/sulfonate/bicarbonate transport system permease component
MDKQRYNKFFASVLIIILLLIIWVLATHGQSSRADLFFPRPAMLLQELREQYGSILIFALTTWYRVIAGLLIGTISGTAAGILMSYSRWLYWLLDPLIELLRPVPPIALIPFFILWLGLGNSSQLLLISLGCFMIITVSVYVGIVNTPPIFVKAAMSLGANKVQLYRTVYIPAILPGLLSGIRVALASSFSLTVAAEYLGAQGGLGYLIRNARQILQTETILLAAIILGLQSLVTDQLIRWLFSRITKWVPK